VGKSQKKRCMTQPRLAEGGASERKVGEVPQRGKGGKKTNPPRRIDTPHQKKGEAKKWGTGRQISGGCVCKGRREKR